RPEARSPSRAPLLLGLEPRPLVTPRRALVAAAALALGGAGLALFGRTPGPPPCRGLEARLAGVWDDGLRAATRRAFVATGRPAASDIADRASAMLDDYTRGWLAMRRDACEATQVRGEQSPALLDLRMQCLDRRLGQVRALPALLARRPDPDLLPNAIPAVVGLQPLDGCADAAALTAATPPPREPGRRAWLAAL